MFSYTNEYDEKFNGKKVFVDKKNTLLMENVETSNISQLKNDNPKRGNAKNTTFLIEHGQHCKHVDVA